MRYLVEMHLLIEAKNEEEARRVAHRAETRMKWGSSVHKLKQIVVADIRQEVEASI